MMSGHNIEGLEDKVKEIVSEYVESLKRSAEENDIRSDLRDRAEELGIDKKALQDGVSRAKASLKKREGYDESMEIIKSCVDDAGGAENLFKWYLDKQEAKKKEREEAREKRKAEKKAGKSDEEKSIGAEQAETVLKSVAS